MPELEHRVAIYFDENFTRHEIKASSLIDPQVMADARKLELWDETEQMRLQPRGGVKVQPHFYESASSRVPRKLFDGERNLIHDERVAKLIKQLSGIKNLKFVIAHPQKDAPDRIEPLYTFPNYSWKSEVQRILSADTIVRHDIYGQSPELSMSVKFPWVAVEVVNTHYPSEPAFAAMLKASKDYPLIVLFDFTAETNRFIKVDALTGTLRIRPWSFYIKEGQLWKGLYPTSIETPIDFKQAKEKMVLDWERRRKG